MILGKRSTARSGGFGRVISSVDAQRTTFFPTRAKSFVPQRDQRSATSNVFSPHTRRHRLLTRLVG